MARLMVSKMVTKGSASIRPPEKIWLPADTSKNQPPAASGASAIGNA